MTTKSVVLSGVMGRIFEITGELGKMEGMIQAKGYSENDCSTFVLETFEETRTSVRSMREELTKVYTRMHYINEDCASIVIPEVREVFEKQMMALHEKRGVLEKSLRSFETLMSTHVLIREVELDLFELTQQVKMYDAGELAPEDWHTISDKIEELVAKVRVVFPTGKKGESPSKDAVLERKIEMQQDLNVLRLKVNLKHNKYVEGDNKKAQEGVEKLVLLLNGLKNTPLDSRSTKMYEEVKKCFKSLPLDLRMEIFEAGDVFPNHLTDTRELLMSASNKQVVRDCLGALMGVAYYDRERAETLYRSKYEGFPNNRLNQRVEAKAELDEGLSEMPMVVLEDPRSLLSYCAKALERYRSYQPLGAEAVAILQESQCAQNASDAQGGAASSTSEAAKGKEPLLSVDSYLKTIPEIKSLEALKTQLMALKEEKQFDSGQKEQLAKAMLEVAEQKGVNLAEPNGVYYWIWFLAHEKDSKAGGDNYGKINAPKDLDRLLQATEKAAVLKRPPPPTAAEILKNLGSKKLNSLDALRDEVGQINSASNLSGNEKEQIVKAMLDGAEKQGVALAEANGVYYWIWALAYEKDKKAGGDNYGKINAPKDLTRLLQAIEKAAAMKQTLPLGREVERKEPTKQSPPPLVQTVDTTVPVKLSSIPTLQVLQQGSTASQSPVLTRGSRSSSGATPYLNRRSLTPSKGPYTETEFVESLPAKRLSSLVDLRRELSLIITATTHLRPEEMERIVAAVLKEAMKQKLDLNKDKGVYYWVWFLAHEENSNAGGADFGEVNAPKNFKRLLDAIDRAKG